MSIGCQALGWRGTGWALRCTPTAVHWWHWLWYDAALDIGGSWMLIDLESLGGGKHVGVGGGSDPLSMSPGSLPSGGFCPEVSWLSSDVLVLALFGSGTCIVAVQTLAAIMSLAMKGTDTAVATPPAATTVPSAFAEKIGLAWDCVDTMAVGTTIVEPLVGSRPLVGPASTRHTPSCVAGPLQPLATIGATIVDEKLPPRLRQAPGDRALERLPPLLRQAPGNRDLVLADAWSWYDRARHLCPYTTYIGTTIVEPLVGYRPLVGPASTRLTPSYVARPLQLLGTMVCHCCCVQPGDDYRVETQDT